VDGRRIERTAQLTAGATVRAGPEAIQLVAASPNALTTGD
jgi:hypothetical protein